ncbi:MAG: hypothetical protein KAR38_02545, partial [Calditrichia bacterium]|nr:hypothetical protein [Calditrichia bacterium]
MLQNQIKFHMQTSFSKLIVIILMIFSLVTIIFTYIDNNENSFGYIKNKNNTKQYEESCTIGVASVIVAADGRPLLWKVRDNDEKPDNKVYYNTSFQFKFISVINLDDTEAWMGVNEKGFAIVNSTARDLSGGDTGFDNGELMRYSLGTCETVLDFENLLKKTDSIGRRTQANFAVIDSLGNAVIYEAGGKSHWKFDANNPEQAPDGYIIRSNFSINGGGSTGIERYNRADKIISDFFSGDSLSHKNILRYFIRDFSDLDCEPVEIPFNDNWIAGRPFGYVYTNVSICRKKSVSASVIHGVKPDESSRLSTMWTMLGQPAASIALPYWPVGITPELANGDSTAKLCDISNKIKTLLFDYAPNDKYIDSYKLRDNLGNGLWSTTFYAEDSIIDRTNLLLNEWREQLPESAEMLQIENEFCDYAYLKLKQGNNDLLNSMVLKIANSLPFNNENGTSLANGNIVQLVWSGNDASIAPPINNVGSLLNGQTTGDDSILYTWNTIADSILLEGRIDTIISTWCNREAGIPARNDKVYLRVFNRNDLKFASYYADAQLHQIQNIPEETYDPVLNNGMTDQSLEIKLSSFISETGNNNISLKWSTAFSVNNVEFIVEKAVTTSEFFKKIASFFITENDTLNKKNKKNK